MPAFENAYMYMRLMAKNIYTSQFATKVELNSKVTQSSDKIMAEVNKKVGEDEFGLQLQLNSEALRLAWNQISQYLQLQGIEGKASLVIYDDNDKKLIVYDSTGQHFYNSSDKIFGEMGVKTVDNKNYIAFSVPSDYGKSIEDGMAWGMTTESDKKFYPILFIKNFNMANKDAGNFSGELVLNYCDLLLNSGGIISGNVKMLVDDVANGLIFQDKTTETILLSIYPQNELGNTTINLLNNVISFFQNNIGNNSLKIGMGSNPCVLTDEGLITAQSIILDNLSVYNGSVHLGSPDNKVSFDLYVNNMATIIGDLDVDGKVYADNISSDRKFKKNIKDSEVKALDLINKIKHKQFEMKKDDIHYNIGYIAQELEEIDKNFVMKKQKDKESEEKYYINELPIIATITKAIQEIEEDRKKDKETIQEQQKTIKELQEKIKEMEEKLNGKN